MVEVKNFSGFMNLDDPDSVLPESHHRYAKNVSFKGNGNSTEAQSINGNVEVTNSLLPNTGINLTIGTYYDSVNNRIFIFNHNSAGKHGIYIYNTRDNSFQLLLLQGNYTSAIGSVSITVNSGVLNFSDTNPITSINIIYGDQNSGDLLYYVDSDGTPTKLNVNTYLNGYYTTIKREFIDVAKAPPIMPIKPVYENTNTSLMIGYSKDKQGSVNNGVNLYLTGTVVVGAVVNVYVQLNPIITPINTEEVGTTYPQTTSPFFAMPPYTVVSGDTVSSILSHIVSQINGYTVQVVGGSIEQPFLASYSSGDHAYVIPYNDFATSPMTSYEVSGSVGIFDPSVPIFQNNLKNKLFQFRYRYYYDDNEYSVCSAASIVPLPNQSITNQPIFGQTTTEDETKNSRIKLFFSTGDVNVKKIELLVRVFSDNAVSDWMSLDILDKTILSIPSNTVYSESSVVKGYIFYNNRVLTPIPNSETSQLFDYVPQKANTQELINGNTLIYGGITEGYNQVSSNQQINTTTTDPTTTYTFFDLNGMLVFAQMNGLESGVDGKSFTVHFAGCGINDSDGNPTTFESPYADGGSKAVVNVLIGSTIYSVTFDVVASISTTISNFLIALATASSSFTNVTGTNYVTVTYTGSGNIRLLSSGTKLLYSDVNNTGSPTGSVATLPMLSYADSSNQYFGVQYFDSKGRTNGVVTNVGMNVRIPTTPFVGDYMQQPPFVQLQINHTPPSWASYYQVVRSRNLTYSKLLHWITKRVFADKDTVDGVRYAYLDISNIADYVEQLKTTTSAVSYDFASGDRVSLYGVINSTNTQSTFNQIYDFEVVSLETNPSINGIKQTGSFLKIYYPTQDVGSDFNFSGSPNYQNYQVVIYNHCDISSKEYELFYEFGKCFGISNGYHIGLEQTQTASQPAKISINNGDYFYRQRNVYIGETYGLLTKNNGLTFTGLTSIFIPLFNSIAVDYNSKYSILPYTSSTTPNGTTSSYSTFLNTGHPSDGLVRYYFDNTSTSSIKTRLRCTIPITSSANTVIGFLIQITINSSKAYVYPVVKFSAIVPNNSYSYDIDYTVVVPAGATASLVGFVPAGNGSGVILGDFDARLDVFNNFTMPVIDQSYSDLVRLYANSNGRTTSIDRTITNSNYNTLVRWSEGYQLGTNINNTNRFYFNNFDEFSKENGQIQRLKIHGKELRVFQYRRCGRVGVYSKFVKDVDGNNTLITSDSIINKNNIQYYEGDFGIGNQPASLFTSGYDDYFVDPVKGYIIRLSLNGTTPISEVYKVQSFAGDAITKYLTDKDAIVGGTAKVLGVYYFKKDKHGECLFFMQGSQDDTIEQNTLAFDEKNNHFTSFYDIYPEWACAFENNLATFINGQLFLHNNTTQNNFFGSQYSSDIEFVFNGKGMINKDFNFIKIDSSDVFEIPTVTTSLGQNSNIVENDYEIMEGMYNAAFLRDTNSLGGLVNGDFLKGTWIKVYMQQKNSSNFVSLSGLGIAYQPSGRNF